MFVVNICKCFETVGLAVLKLAAIAPAVMACEVRRSNIALLVGSAIAWKTSRLKFILIHLTINIRVVI